MTHNGTLELDLISEEVMLFTLMEFINNLQTKTSGGEEIGIVIKSLITFWLSLKEIITSKFMDLNIVVMVILILGLKELLKVKKKLENSFN